MHFTIFGLEKGLVLLFLVSPVILVLFAREIRAEPEKELGEIEEEALGTEGINGAKPQAHQNQDPSYKEILAKLRSYEEFMTKMNGVSEKLNEIYTLMPLLQELKEERLKKLEREPLLEKESLRLERPELEPVEHEPVELEPLEQETLQRDPLEQERLKGQMMKSPRAKLYTQKNLTGDFETYDFNSASIGRGCHRLQNYSRQIKSIDTEGTCVRLFRHCNCIVWSQAFYPGVDVNAIDPKLEGVRCIGPCSPNELEVAEIKGSFPKLTVRKRRNGVPDLIDDYYKWNNKTSVSSSSSSSITRYNLGVGNRLEGVEAWIYPRHLRSPEEAEQVRNAGLAFTAGQLNLNGDREEVGFAIPLELGGVSDQLYNIFPQDKALGIKYRDAFVPVFKEYLENRPLDFVAIQLRFFYENPTATKPKGIWYWYYSNERVWGYLFN